MELIVAVVALVVSLGVVGFVGVLEVARARAVLRRLGQGGVHEQEQEHP